MYKKITKKILSAIAVAAFWILLWFIAARAVGLELLLPSPIAVVKRLSELASEKEFYIIAIGSVIRVLCGIALALICGVLLAVGTHISRVADAITAPLITVIKATPVASFIILALVWIDRSKLPVFISFLMVLPVVTTNLRTGLGEVDKGILEMAKVFKIGVFKKIFGIYIPSVMPYFTSAVKTSLGLAWKAGIAAEVLAVPKDSIGKKLAESKNYLETTELFAWTLLVIVLSLIIEFIFEALIARLMRKRRYSDVKN